MNKQIVNEHGTIIINKEVIAMIAGAAAIECYGLVGMASKSAGSGIVDLLKREHLTKGINITFEDEALIIDLYVVVQFGTKISVVAENIIKKVKYNVENQTGLTVKKVNLNIEGVRVQS
ncbi:MAG: Asp23/Gls24 family envelope stress response protein [Clostridiales bacterium]|nr:MAG: Asp23/Gls24 family envelope stress response protein [Clostridiales bacterium]